MNFDRIDQILKQQEQAKPVLEAPTPMAQAMYEALKKQAQEAWEGKLPEVTQTVTDIPKKRGRPRKNS